MKVTLKNGSAFEADAVVRSSKYPVLHIHTSDLTFAAAAELFEDPNACIEISVDRGGDVVNVYHDFTVLQSIQKDPLMQNEESTEILIWMQRPQEDYD